MMKLRVLCSALISALACTVSAGAQTADDINFNTTYQTIRGFGVATAWQPLMSSTVVNSLWGTGAGQMGLTMVRQRIDPSSTTGGSNWSTELQNSLEVLAVAPDATVFATPWTPPAVWKSNDSTIEGTLTTANYANYANYLNEYIAYMKAGGVNLYAISMQNEPDANVTYESCVWTGATMDAWVAQEGGTINTKLIMPESESFIEGLSDPALADPNAVGKISIIGGHLYGATPYYYTNAKNAGKDVWMTEHYVQASGSTPAIGDGINVAKEVHNSMAVGQYNAYVWWWANSDIQQGLLNSSNTPSYNGLALAQFSKFVRPGYVMTGANNSPVSGVYITSYKGSSNYVIVAINSNSGASSIDFAISGATLTSVTPYQTSASNQLAQLSAVSVSNDAFTYSLPGQSITTFVGTGSSSGSSGFTLAPSAPTLSLSEGGTTTDTITVTDSGSFTGSVTLAASGLPSGVTAAFGTNPTTGSSVVTFTASSSAATGTSTVTITGTSGSATATATIALTVTGPTLPAYPITTGTKYTVANEASAICVNDTGGATANGTAVEQEACSAGDLSQEWLFTSVGTNSWEITTANLAGAAWNVIGPSTAPGTGIQLYGYYSGALNMQFEAFELSSGLTEFIDENSGLCLNFPTTTAGQQMQINTCNGSTSEEFSLTPVTAGTPSFTLAPSASSLSVTQGSSATDTVTVADENGFTGAASFTATGLPSGVTASFSPASSTSSSVLTLTASSTATTGGPVTVTVTGTSGSTTASTTISLTVNPLVTSGFTISPSASTLAVTQGSSGTDTVTAKDIGGFTGSVAFTASGMPSGVTASFSPTSSATSSVLTLTASSTATTGAFTITVTGTSGTTTETTTITLSVGTSGGSACTVDYTIAPQSPSTFGATIKIINNGSTALSGWSLTWSFANGQTIASSWNGTASQSGANVTVSEQAGQTWENIPAGGSYAGFGFNGTWNGTTNAIPTAFSLNGTACTVN
jgi:glucuronoarabinoxylan endo-1,4-beta-xylanase